MRRKVESALRCFTVTDMNSIGMERTQERLGPGHRELCSVASQVVDATSVFHRWSQKSTSDSVKSINMSKSVGPGVWSYLTRVNGLRRRVAG
jgi:hypothetical protein